MKTDYLMHHGILGQRWGIRRFQNKDGSYTAAGKDRYGVKGSREKADSEDSSKRKGLSDKQKDILKKVAIGTAIVGGAAFATYMGVRMYKDGKFNPIIDKFKEMGKNGIERSGSDTSETLKHVSVPKLSETKQKWLQRGEEIAKQTGLKKQDPITDGPENLRLSNENPAPNNCSHCVVAWVLRQMGLDVTALPIEEELGGGSGGITPSEFTRYFKFPEERALDFKKNPVKIPNNKSVSEVKQELAKEILKRNNGQDSMGIWNCQGKKTGHFMGWAISNGEVIFTNPQIGNYNCDQFFEDLANGTARSRDIHFARLDDLDPMIKGGEKDIRRAVVSR